MQYAYLSSSCLTQCKLFHIFISNSQWFVFHHILVTISRVPCAVNFVMCALLLDLPYSVKKKQKKIMYICMYVVSDTEHTVAKNIWANVWWQNTGWLLKHNANSDTTLTHICNISKVASKALLFTRVKTAVVCMYVCMYLICQMQTTDKATTKQCTHWQDSEAQHALTTALDKKNKHHKHFQNQNST